jgi:hypothetical protein
MSAYDRVDVVSDTPEWEEERRRSVGASEVAAVMGLSRFNTALDVYKHKHGIDRDFDPVLAFIGHQSEPIMHAWVEKFSGVRSTSSPGSWRGRRRSRTCTHRSTVSPRPVHDVPVQDRPPVHRAPLGRGNPHRHSGAGAGGNVRRRHRPRRSGRVDRRA